MRWEDQELNRLVPENKFPEVQCAGLFLSAYVSRHQGRYLHIDQQALERMVEKGDLPPKAAGARINRLCLWYRLACRLGPGGDNYPVLGVMQFWLESVSLYAILYISAQNDWLQIMVVPGEPPNEPLQPTGASRSGQETIRGPSAAGSGG